MIYAPRGTNAKKFERGRWQKFKKRLGRLQKLRLPTRKARQVFKAVVAGVLPYIALLQGVTDRQITQINRAAARA